MTELMNLEMVLPAPLNPPFPERAKMSELGLCTSSVLVARV